MMTKARSLAFSALATAALGLAACASILGIEDTLTFVGNDAGDAATELTRSDGAPAPSGTAWVQSKTTSGFPGPSTTLAFDRPVAAHNAVVVAMSIDPGTATLQSVTDSLGNSYPTVVGPYGGPLGTMFIAASTDVQGSRTAITVRTSGAQNLDLAIHEYSGLTTSDAVDKTSSANGTTSNNDRTARASVTTSASNELLFALVVAAGDVYAGAGFMTHSQSPNGQVLTE
jgi:hypothetical protein